MSDAGGGSPAHRKRPLGPASASGGGGEPGSPRAKRRLFAAGWGPASRTATTAAAAAEADGSLQRRRLIIQAAAFAAAAASVCFLLVMRRRRGREPSAQQLAPLREALANLASAVRAATAPAEPRPELYPAVMAVPGFADEQLLTAHSYLVERRARGAGFLQMSGPHRALWIRQILARHQEL